MRNIKDMKKEIEIIMCGFTLIFLLVITTITISKSPNIFCNFISWLGVCEEVESTYTQK